MSNLFQRTQGGVLDFFNMFSGGALERMSVIALGVMPYITASIVIQLATSLSPTLGALKKEGESGRKKLNRSEERRVGQGCVSKGRSRLSPYPYKKKINTQTHDKSYN